MGVHGKEFTVSRELYDVLSGEDGPVRVYYSPHSSELLSLEPVKAVPPT